MLIAKMLQNLLLQDTGQTLSEYGIILLFLVIVTVAAVTLFGNQVAALLVQATNMF